MAILNVSRKQQLYSIYSLYLGVAIFIVGSTIAMLTYPDYSMSDNYFSDTGLRIDYLTDDRGVIEAHPYPEIFNGTQYLLAIFLVPFTFVISTFFTKEENKYYLFTLATLPGVVISLALMGVGIWDFGNNFDKHLLAARITMGSIGIFFVLWTLGVLSLSSDAKYKQFKS
ncbi:MAG: hypothetical protein ACXAC2_11750 [Candidatus Kariarchaeaceae archaeon]